MPHVVPLEISLRSFSAFHSRITPVVPTNLSRVIFPLILREFIWDFTPFNTTAIIPVIYTNISSRFSFDIPPENPAVYFQKQNLKIWKNRLLIFFNYLSNLSRKSISSYRYPCRGSLTTTIEVTHITSEGTLEKPVELISGGIPKAFLREFMAWIWRHPQQFSRES